MANHKRILSSYTGKLTPAQQKRVDKFIKPGSHKWTAQWSGDNNRILFEITRGKQKLEVNLQQHTCTCNMWQLSGMLCVYAVAAISKLRVRTAEDFVSPLLTMDAVRATYNVCVKPVNSEEFWKEASQPKPDPPRITRPVGRPKKRRSDAAHPPPQPNGDKVRSTFQVTCNKCGKKGALLQDLQGSTFKT
ncbi:uncharacterized protein LOC110281454 [Arachis duranensis]|uniref:Uncharacterized protein LOC110281454 n=1 Tax=Arachis duranensis TaxID=130453 RepID=A0A6P5NR97_ARADU|nr:uncharacterized protein LOC110281454 [Arachis duranensis]